MALTGTDRGTGTNNVSSTTTTLSPASNFTGGSIAVLAVAADNAHSGGTAYTTFTVTDTLGNTWTRRQTALIDPGAANAGQVGAFFETAMNGGVLQTSTTITITFDTASTAETWTLMEVDGSIGTPTYVTGNVGTSGTGGTSPTITTSSIPVGDMVIAGLFLEAGTTETITQDGDSTNGSWSTQQTAEIGSTTSGSNIATQRKVVTGAGTQTYNPTLGILGDLCLAWVQYTETLVRGLGQAQAKITSTGYGLGQAQFYIATPYVKEVLADNPTGYWRLDELSGTTAFDGKGGFNGTYTATPTLGAVGALTQESDTAVTFNGSTQYVTVTDAVGIQPGNGNWSYELWFKCRVVPDTSKIQRLLMKGNTGNASPMIYLDNGVAGRLIAYSDGWGQGAHSSVNITDTNWHHVIFTKDAAHAWSIYLDGIDVTVSDTAAQTGPAATGNLNFGRSTDNTKYFDGSLDEIAFYLGTALTVTRAKAHYDAAVNARGSAQAQAQILKAPGGFGQAQAQIKSISKQVAQAQTRVASVYELLVRKMGPASYWKLDEQPGATTIGDQIGGITGTVHGSPTFSSALNAFGSIQTGIAFTDSTSYIDFGDTYDFTGTASFTIVIWYKRTGTNGDGTDRLISKYGAGEGWEIYNSETDDSVIFTRHNSGGSVISGFRTLNTVDMIAGSYNGSNRFTINGPTTKVGDADSTAMVGNTALLIVGNGSPANVQYASGVIGEVAIFSKFLSFDDLQALRTVGFSGAIERAGQAQAFIRKGAGYGQANTLITTSPVYTTVLDTFTRSVTDGMGTSDNAGAWTFLNGTAANVDVNGSALTVISETGGNTQEVWQLKNTLISKSVEISGYFSIDKLPITASQLFDILSHQGSSTAATIANVGINLSIIIDSAANFSVFITHNGFGNGKSVSGYSAGATWGVKAQMLHGFGKIVTKIKIWDTSGSEPEAWSDINTTGTNLHEEGFLPGHVRIYAETYQADANGPFTWTIDNIKIINAYLTGHGQAQAYITFTALKAQAQASVNQSKRTGQAQAKINAFSTSRVAQAQATVNYYPYQRGQALALIVRTPKTAQSAALITKNVITALDTFSLDSTVGFTIADVGGTWLAIVPTNPANQTSVGFGYGIIKNAVSIGGLITYLSDASSPKLGQITCEITIISLSTATRSTTNIFGIYTQGSSTTSAGVGLGIRLYVDPITLDYGFSYSPTNAALAAASDISISSGRTFDISKTYKIRFQYKGTEQTTPSSSTWNTPSHELRARVWPTNESEPEGWLLSAIVPPTTANDEIVPGGLLSLQFTQLAPDEFHIDNYTMNPISWTEYGQAQATIIAAAGFTGGLGQAQADVKAQGFGLGQAQCDVKAIGYGLGQANCDIKQIEYGSGQAQADVKTQGYGLGQAQCDVKTQGYGLGQANCDIKTQNRGFGQAQCTVRGNAFGQAQCDIKTIGFGLSQAQADIKRQGYGLGQAQVDIKAVGFGLGQAQADIKTQGYGLGQAQADIKTQNYGSGQAQCTVRGNAFGQAQCDIKAISWGLGQANCDIKQVGYGLGQAQVDIKAQGYGIGQAQCDVKTKGFGLGQANADIKTQGYGLGQAQTDIKVTYSQCAQANTDIKQTGYGLGQAQCDVKAQGYGLGQAQCNVKVAGYGLGQSQADIKAQGYGLGQAQCDVRTQGYGLGQCQADIKQIYWGLGQAQCDIKAVGYGFGQAQCDIKVTYSQCAQAQTDIKAQGYGLGQAQCTVVGNAYGQAQIDVRQTYWGSGQAQCDVKAIYTGCGQANAAIRGAQQQYAQAQADILVPEFGLGQSNADIKTTYWGLGQAQADILHTYFGSGQAMCTVVGNAFGQAQCDIRQIYYQCAQAQADIRVTFSQCAQAQADIKAQGYGLGQANCDIKVQGYGQGQAQCDIRTQGYGSGQATCDIKQIGYGSGQAQCDIRQIYYQCAQAQADIKAQSYGEGQANADVKTQGYGLGQAQCDILQTYYQFAQAQADIRVTYSQCAQAQADIKSVGYGSGQALCDIKTQGYGEGQSQTDIKTQGYGLGQAQCDIITQGYGLGQAQTDIQVTYYGSGQAQTDIKANGYGEGQSQVDIKTQGYGLGQAQAKLNAFGQCQFGQAQCTIRFTGTIGCGQAQAKLNAFNQCQFGQANCDIKVIGYGEGQANVDIKVTSNQCAQAQTDIKVTTSQCVQANVDIKAQGYGLGQANCDIKAIGYGSGQAQADIKTKEYGLGQAQCSIHVITQGCGQAQADIKVIGYGSGQSNTDIKSTVNGLGQAQADIRATGYGSGQAQCYVRLINYAEAQAQADIKRIISQSTQSQTDIKTTTTTSANAQALIRTTVICVAQAACVIKKNVIVSGQAQATIQNGGYGLGQAQAKIILAGQSNYAQAQALIIKSAGYAQANAQINQPHTLKRLDIFIRETLGLIINIRSYISLTTGIREIQLITNERPISMDVGIRETPSMDFGIREF